MEKQKNTDNQALFLSSIKSDFLYCWLKFNIRVLRGNPKQRSGSALCAIDVLMLFFSLSIHTQQEDLIHSCVTIKAGIHYKKHCTSDALMLFFCLINTQEEDLIHSCVTIKASIHYTNTAQVMLYCGFSV